MIVVAVIVGASLLAWKAWRRFFWVSPRPRMLRTAERGRGTLDVVVVDDGLGERSEGARPALLRRGADVGRRMIVRVLPEGSSRRDADEAGSQLCRYADAVGTPAAGAALLFGTPDTAVGRFATGEGYDVVLNLGDDPGSSIDCNRRVPRRRSITTHATRNWFERERPVAAPDERVPVTSVDRTVR